MINREKKHHLCELRNISKKFDSIIALEKFNLAIDEGSVIAIVGDNGAGKTTAMKILSGFFRKDSGDIYWEGQKVNFRSTFEARTSGIDMVYQDLGIVEYQNVVQNIFLGREISKPLFFSLLNTLNISAMEKYSKEILKKLGAQKIELDDLLVDLSGGQRQSVAIARSLIYKPKLLILDEPTASLGVIEVKKILKIIEKLKNQKLAVILISHRLEDVFQVSDRIVILYNGKKVADLKTCKVNKEIVLRYMLGLRYKRQNEYY